jgi:hypothetical protein
MGFEVPVTVKISMVFQAVTVCGVVSRYQRFGLKSSEDGGSMFLQNIGIHLQAYKNHSPD